MQQGLAACLQSLGGSALGSPQGLLDLPGTHTMGHRHLSPEHYSDRSEFEGQDPGLDLDGGDYTLSEDEDMPQEQQASSALFPQLFLSLSFIRLVLQRVYPLHLPQQWIQQLHRLIRSLLRSHRRWISFWPLNFFWITSKDSGKLQFQVLWRLRWTANILMWLRS